MKIHSQCPACFSFSRQRECLFSNGHNRPQQCTPFYYIFLNISLSAIHRLSIIRRLFHSPLHSLHNQDAHIHNKSWYAGTCDRKTADDLLSRSNKVRAQLHRTSSVLIFRSQNFLQRFLCFQDGAFTVRKSSGQDAQQPYTLVVLFKGRVYNIPVRLIPATQQYALGREKRGEEVLDNFFFFSYFLFFLVSKIFGLLLSTNRKKY